MENQFFSYDGKNLYSKVTGEKVATAQKYFDNNLGIEESINFCLQGALIKKKIGLMIEISFISNDGTKLFCINSKKFQKHCIYDINAYILKKGILLAYSLQNNFSYEYRTFDGKIKSALTMAELVDKIKQIDEKNFDDNERKHNKSKSTYTKFVMSCLGQDDEENNENF